MIQFVVPFYPGFDFGLQSAQRQIIAREQVVIANDRALELLQRFDLQLHRAQHLIGALAFLLANFELFFLRLQTPLVRPFDNFLGIDFDLPYRLLHLSIAQGLTLHSLKPFLQILQTLVQSSDLRVLLGLLIG